jgi:serpin B
MGMNDAFDPDLADFSALGECGNGDNLYIGQVIHKTFLKLDEKGTRAGAAAAVTVFATSAMREAPPRVILDRPFIYLLLDTETNIPLFIGTVDSLA